MERGLDLDALMVACLGRGTQPSGGIAGETDAILPAYWERYLPEKIAAVRTLQNDGGKDAFSFIVITDIHYGDNGYGKVGNEGWSPLLAKRIADACDIKYVLCLGDAYNRYAQGRTRDDALAELEKIRIMLAPIKDRLLITRGNHDVAYGRYDKDGDGDYEGVGDELMCYNLTENELHEFFYRPVSMIDGVHFDESGTGYYVDDAANKVRFIVLNTHCNPSTLEEDGTAKYNSYGTFRFTQSQFDLVEEALLGVPSDSWSVIVASHAPIAGSYGVDAFDGEAPIMRAFLNAYQNKTTYTGTFAGTGDAEQEETEIPFTNLVDASNATTSPAGGADERFFIGWRYSTSQGTPSNSGVVTHGVTTNTIRIKDENGNPLIPVGGYLHVKGIDIKTTSAMYWFNENLGYVNGEANMHANSAVVVSDYDENVYKIPYAFVYGVDAPYIKIYGGLTGGEGTHGDVIVTNNEKIIAPEQPEVSEKPYDYVSLDVDFTHAKGQIIGYFSGHTHKDLELTADDWSIKTITGRCDGRAEDSASEAVLDANRTVGTITEQSFNVFTVNKKTHRIHATKIGAGEDREIAY